jgi:hypothetical protein
VFVGFSGSSVSGIASERFLLSIEFAPQLQHAGFQQIAAGVKSIEWPFSPSNPSP